MTFAERLKKMGIEKGIQQGKLAGKQGILLKQLALKFDSVSEEIRERVEQLSHDELERSLERILSASSIEAVF